MFYDLFMLFAFSKRYIDQSINTKFITLNPLVSILGQVQVDYTLYNVHWTEMRYTRENFKFHIVSYKI